MPRLLTCETDGCGKVCKSKCGLKRHQRAKHDGLINDEKVRRKPCKKTALQKLHPFYLKQMVEASAKALSVDECFPDDYRESYNNFDFTHDEAVELFSFLENIISDFEGDAESFYANFFELCFENNIIKNKLGDDHGTLLLHELANHVLHHLVGKKLNAPVEANAITEKERSGIQYLSGYVFHKTYCNLRRNKHYHDSVLLQQSAEILRQSRVDDKSQRLISIKNRGGLWTLQKDVENMFIEVEKIFREKTAIFVTKIDYKEFVDFLFTNAVVYSCYKNIYTSIDVTVDKENADNLLEILLGLYIRVRSHSYAKDVREKNKIQKKCMKKNSLRTEIKKNHIQKMLVATD